VSFPCLSRIVQTAPILPKPHTNGNRLRRLEGPWRFVAIGPERTFLVKCIFFERFRLYISSPTFSADGP
jgi:hypothetical protein